jgi:hypothetical protein
MRSMGHACNVEFFWQIVCANIHESCLSHHGFTNAFACWMMHDNQNLLE